MAELGEERSAEEVLKLRFEFFKHMTTVSTASTAAVIAVYGLSEKALRGEAEDWKGKDWDWLVSVTLAIPGFAIGGFFLSLLLCLWGLYLVAQALFTQENSAAISGVLRWSAATFILGVGISAATAGLIVAGPLIAALLVAIFGILATVILFRLGVRQSIRAAQQAQALAGAASAPVPPAIISTFPNHNETGVAPTIDVKAIFSKDMMASSITAETFKLFKKGSITEIAARVSYPDPNSPPYTAKLDPKDSLQSGGTYEAVVSTGAKDLAGNSLPAQGSRWFFTVR